MMYHLEEAAIAGHPEARYALGIEKWNNGDKESAVKHSLIAAKLGYDRAVEAHYRVGILYGDGKGVEKDIGKEI